MITTTEGLETRLESLWFLFIALNIALKWSTARRTVTNGDAGKGRWWAWLQKERQDEWDSFWAHAYMDLVILYFNVYFLMLKVILIWWYMRSTARKLSTYLISLTCSISIYPLLTSTSSRQWTYCEITSQSLRQWWKKSSERTYIWKCRTFNVRHTEMTEHIESVAVLPNVLRSYYMCCFLSIRCVADPIRGVCRSSYTLDSEHRDFQQTMTLGWPFPRSPPLSVCVTYRFTPTSKEYACTKPIVITQAVVLVKQQSPTSINPIGSCKNHLHDNMPPL